MMAINIAAWLFIHLSVSFMVAQSSPEFISRFSRIYALRDWEKSGRIYEDLRIKKWKHRLPEARKWFNRGVGKKGIQIRHSEGLRLLKNQTDRSELSHWLQILPAPLFFLFNPAWAGWVMVLYGILFNLPFIIVQRYNRTRLNKIRVYSE